MGRRAKPAKVKAEAKRPLARKAPKQEAPGIPDLEKRLAEALEQQAATAEILRVISSSPTDIQRVLNAVAQSAARLCGASDVLIRRVDGDVLRLQAHIGSVPIATGTDFAISRRTPMGHAILERRTIHIHDVLEPHVREEYPDSLFLRNPGRYRTMLCAPLLREDTAIGAIIIRRPELRPFSVEQIKLLETFAAQAAIAIENTRLFNETKEALEQQTATADILRVISSSPTDIQPVLDAVAESAARLCGASDVVIRQVDGNVLPMVAHFGSIPALTGAAPAVSRTTFMGHAVLERRTIHIHDVLEPHVREKYPDSLFLKIPGHYRTALCAPLLREDTAIGAIIIRRPEVRPFSDKQIKLLEIFAAQAAIAIENTRLFNETKEALEQQTATADILRVISSSPTDLQPVFDTILGNAMRLCEAHRGLLRVFEGDSSRIVAEQGMSAAFSEWRRNRVEPPGPFSAFSELIAKKRVVHIPDLAEWPGYARAEPVTVASVELGGTRTYLGVPMLKEGALVGAIVLHRPEVRPFTDKQIALLKTFADQALLAIENVRLFKELEARNKDLGESLEQQTVTSEILKIISSSPTDTQPVFDAIVKSGVRLFGGLDMLLRLVKGDHTESVASTLSQHGVPILLTEQGSPSSRAIQRRKVVQVADVAAADWVHERMKQSAESRGFRAIVCAPMLRENDPIGVINVTRATPGPFTEKQVALLKTFADQAVIAIENVRLFKELQARNAEVTEALEQQTATAEILKVISSSPTDIKPVFDAILENATRLCDAHMGVLGLYDGETYHRVAQRGASAEFARWLAEEGPKYPPDPRGMVRQMIAERRPIHVLDRREQRAYRERNPGTVALVELGGARSSLVVPMLKEGRVVGGIIIYRPEVRAFTQKQIDLVSTFANQAVIAIENVRLFNETKEALERQTATAEILKVISSSPTDVQPVLDTVAERSNLLCRAEGCRVWLAHGGLLHPMASYGTVYGSDSQGEVLPLRTTSPVGRAFLERRCVHVEDIVPLVETEYPDTREIQARYGFRTVLTVPMLRKEESVGVIALLRFQMRPFTPAEISLVQTFADQAVIAIENVRLFNETKEALEQQTATAEILKVISSSPTDTQPVFDAIVKSGVRLFGGLDVSLRLVRGDQTEMVASSAPAIDEVRSPTPLSDDRRVSSRSILRREVVQVPDVFAEDWVSEATKQRAKRRGHRAMVIAPMLRENTAIGAIVVTRATPGLFTEKEIALLKTFADQAVIAIENVRLFNETKEALQQQTVISEILRVISSSPTDTQPVFDAIVKSGVQLFGGMNVALRLVKGDRIESVATTLPILDFDSSFSVSLDDESFLAPRAIRRREVMQVPDALADESINVTTQQRARQRGWRAIMSAPMLRENNAIGAINVYRATPGLFTEKQVALLKTFADQAVIAIENVRLFKEINEALERQTATSEVLKVISRSTFDLEPVLESLVDNARKLCDADRATISRADKDGNYAAVIERGLELRPELFAYMQRHPIRPDRGTAIGRAVLERRPVHIPDVQADPEYNRRDLADLGGIRTVLAVPMLREGEPIAVFVLMRTKEVKPFTEKQVELVTTFADQAVIAIENVRLFNEIQDKSRQLEEASRHKSQFLANMSHELRTPLNAILGYTELVLDGIYGDVSAKVQDVMGRVDKSGRHLLGLINDVLDLSKIEAGQLTLSLADYSLTDVVQTVFTSLGSLAAEKKLALKVAAASDLPRGRGDDRRLTQVLLNLVGNAIKFTEAGEVRLEARCSDGAFVVSVADTGPGISEADQQRIFEEFQQVDDSATRKKGGTGLGLSIAKRIIELHGGRIQVESAPGRGSTFTVTLPVRVERQAGTL